MIENDGLMCRTLCRCAERTFERLAESRTAGKALGEESFTDFNLQGLRRARGDRLVTHQFTREEKAGNGADWEWWFHADGHGFGMRVQAKKAHKDGRYVLRHYTRSFVGRVRQSDRLVEDAAASGCLPFYVFYNHRNWTAAGDELAPADCDHTLADQRQMGCTLVSALVVQRAIVERMYGSSDHVKRHSIPWNRVLCDSTVPDVGSLNAVFDRVRALHRDGVLDLRQARERPEVYSYAVSRAEGVGRGEPLAVPPDYGAPPPDLTDRPVYRAFGGLSDGPVRALPARVRQMISGDPVDPPDSPPCRSGPRGPG
ncbi:DUF6615 family protein [Streptomyces goshikiensis]|uniref:DUF6615 family protein n=1 Tax=Streptomyces TaxID=1883 RepID=UPI00131DDC79|nr:DUF6615 family protein [Streptomyces sp. CB02120-2]